MFTESIGTMNSEVCLRSIFNRSPVAIGIGHAASGQLVDVNDAWLLLYGYERDEMIGRTTSELNLYCLPDERIEIVRLIRECGPLVNREVHVRRKSGEHLIVLYSAELIELRGELFLQVMLTDITEQKGNDVAVQEREEQISQALKMEALGLLAGGVAHDFNNILQAISSYSQLIIGHVQDDESVRKYVEEILKATKRAADLTQGLLVFNRKQSESLAVINISDVIQGNEAFLRRLIREDIELNITFSEELLTVLADCGQIELVLMNLVTNARDAMPHGGKILIETQSVALNQGFFETHGGGSAGIYSSFSVSDSGVGMDLDTQSLIFEPFYTTKESGKGTGLGLSMAYVIVKKHNGFITVKSEPGVGTSFNIYLPFVQASAV